MKTGVGLGQHYPQITDGQFRILHTRGPVGQLDALIQSKKNLSWGRTVNVPPPSLDFPHEKYHYQSKSGGHLAREDGNSPLINTLL